LRGILFVYSCLPRPKWKKLPLGSSEFGRIMQFFKIEEFLVHSAVIICTAITIFEIIKNKLKK